MRTKTRDLFRTILTFMLFLFWIGMYVATHVPPSWVEKPKSWRQPSFLPFDKIFHLSSYTILSILFCFWMWLGRMPRLKHLAFCWTILAIYAAFEEVSQGPFGRTVDKYDWFTDLIGITVGCCVTFAFWKFGPRWFSSKLRLGDQTPIIPVELMPHSK